MYQAGREKGKAKQNKRAENNCPPTYPNTLGRTRENSDKQERRHNFCMLIPPALRCGYRLKKIIIIKKNQAKTQRCCSLFQGEERDLFQPSPEEAAAVGTAVLPRPPAPVPRPGRPSCPHTLPGSSLPAKRQFLSEGEEEEIKGKKM